MLLAFCATRYSTAPGSIPLAVGVKFWHMASAALWVAGLGALAALPRLLPTGRMDDIDRPRVAGALIRRFSVVAVVAVTVAFVTGIVIVLWQVPPGAAVATPYGAALALKLALVLGAACLGGFNRFVVYRRLQWASRDSTPAVPGLLALGKVGDDGEAQARASVAALVRAVRIELAVLLAAVALSVAITTTLTPPHEALAPVGSAGTSVGATGSTAVDGVFRPALEFGAVGIALLGSLTLGYELGESSDRRR